MKPGEIIVESGQIAANQNRESVIVTVYNTGDRPIQVGSHYHFFEANRALKFDRAATYGMRLNIAAGTAVRFEPGEDKDVTLISLGGTRTMIGCNGLVQGELDDEQIKVAALQKVIDQGFGTT